MAKNNGTNFVLGAIIGGIVGAVTALVLAPKTGQELRQQLNEQALVVKEKTNSLSKTLTEQSNQLLTKAKGKSDLSEDVFESVENNGPVDQTEGPTPKETLNEELFQEKLAEAQKALADAEDGLHTTQ